MVRYQFNYKPYKKRSVLHKLQYNNEIITNPNEIAEVLNAHFAEIGIKLKDAPPKRNETNYLKYLPHLSQIPYTYYPVLRQRLLL